MSTIDVRDFARDARSIIGDMEQSKQPALIMRRGRPVAYVLPVGSEEFEDFALAHAPEFVEGTSAAEAELAAGQTTSLAEARDELEAHEQTGAR